MCSFILFILLFTSSLQTEAFIAAECKNGFELEKIAIEYSKWVQSPPFDMGVTIGASIGCILKGAKNSAFKKHLEQVGYAKVPIEASSLFISFMSFTLSELIVLLFFNSNESSCKI